jgi:DNA mismatch endonuclease (patch repair protein)
MDVHSAAQRRRNMAAIRSVDTKPELVVRRMVHKMGYRYSLHSRSLPGKPDLVMTRLRKVIFVHGCFWHLHKCRFGRVVPKTNAAFWATKRQANVLRDRLVCRQLKQRGLEVMLIWECQTKRPDRLAPRVSRFLNASP